MFDKSCIDLNNFEVKKIISSDVSYSDVILNDKRSQKIYFGRIVKDENKKKYIIQHKNFLSKLNHPVILKLTGYSPFDFDHQSNPILITKYYKNGTLESLFELKKKNLQSSSFDITSKLKILYGIATGMAYLHSHSIIHCNLSPKSILLDNDYNPIISNFEYAILLGQNQVETPIKSVYTAPEVLENNQYIRENDVYSFSLIMYQLLTDQIPFENAPNDDEELTKTLGNFQPNFSSVQLASTYQKLIEKCCSIDPKNRPTFDQISYFLKNVKDDVNEKDFNQYIEKIKSSKIEYYEQIIQIDSNEIYKHITSELKQQFKKDPYKIKYFIIQEAKKIIYDLTLYYKIHKNLNVKFDVNKIDEVLIQVFQKLATTNSNDAVTIELTNDIKEIIDEKYNMIKENYSLSINSMIIDRIISIIEKYDDNSKEKIQREINNIFCDYYQNVFLFNYDKLREIYSTKTNLKDIIKTLQAINKRFYTKSLFDYDKEPNFVSLYPIAKSKYPKTLSSILNGNCFIITLFGNPKNTHKVLSSLLINSTLTEYQNDNGITIFGPINFESFALNDPNSFTFLKNFNEDFPNLFFIEISNQVSGTDFEDYCNFISYISHFVIFCSDSDNNDSEIDNFQKLILSSNFDGLLINCSKMSINLTKNAKFAAYFDMMKLNEKHLQNYLIKEINQNRIKFIPSEAIIEISKLVLEKNIKTILNQDKNKFKQQIIEKYLNQICKKASEYFEQLAKRVDPKSSDLKNISTHLLNKTCEFFYVNIDIDFWNNEQIERASKVMILECKNDFNTLISLSRYSNDRNNKSIDEKIMDDFYIFIKNNPILSDEEYGKYIYDYYYHNLQKYKGIDVSSLAENIRRTSQMYLPVHINISIDFKSFSEAELIPPNQCKTFFILPTTHCNELFELAKKEFNLQSIPFYIKYNSDLYEMLNDSTCLYQLNSYDYKIFYGVFVESTKSVFESLVNPKKIQIADDFYIETNNHNADYKVSFPRNHKSWFDLEFDITKTHESPKNSKDNLIIFLKLNKNDSSYLLEGNSVELKYYQGNKWVTQKDEVFISFPKCDSAIFPLHHCSKYKISKKNIKQQKDLIAKAIKDEYIDGKYSRNWNYCDPNRAYMKGGQPYYLPVGFESYGIKREKWDKNTCVAFYGTTLEEINSIIENGFELPTESNGEQKFGIKDYDKAIFVSPSIKYASFKSINEKVIFKGTIYVKTGCFVKDEVLEDNCYRLLLLQVRVKPNSFRVFPSTTTFFLNDPHFSDNTIEWRIPNPSDVYAYRILYKFIKYDEFMTSYIEKIQDINKNIVPLSSEMISQLLESKKYIGKGSSSKVYRVVNCFKDILKTDEKYLAIKVFHNDLCTKKVRKNVFQDDDSDDNDPKSFDKNKFNNSIKEAKMINSLNHKNIVKFCGYFDGDKNQNPAIVLEYCVTNLKECISDLKDKYRVSSILEICTVMACLHSHGIWFRDLKPENILINGDKHVKLCDFELAKDSNAIKDKFRSMTNHVGTPFFMAPEMRKSNCEYDEKIDVYSFGILMYFILTKGEYPESEILEKEKMPSEINKLSQKIIKSCWSSLPQKRPSFSEIIKMIVDNYNLLIDGIEKQIPEILKFVELSI